MKGIELIELSATEASEFLQGANIKSTDAQHIHEFTFTCPYCQEYSNIEDCMEVEAILSYLNNEDNFNQVVICQCCDELVKINKILE